jgi:hypothetical protein
MICRQPWNSRTFLASRRVLVGQSSLKDQAATVEHGGHGRISCSLRSLADAYRIDPWAASNRLETRSTSMISLSAFLYVEMAAAASLAFWFIARFPKHGPKSLTSAIGPVVVSLGLGHVVPELIALLREVGFGVYVALFGVVLPLFFSFFLTTGWLLRSFLAAVGGRGGGGGGGHLVEA